MRQGLERRLQATETRYGRTARVAAILCTIEDASDFTGIMDPETLSDAELDWLIDELQRRCEGR